MAGYNESINRTNTDETLVPEQISHQVLQEVPGQSVMLQRARRAAMTTKTMKQPVLSALPDAYWVNGDAGLKQTTAAEWQHLVMTAEELATIVVIPDAFFDDAAIPLWDNIRPLLTEAIGKKLDEATLFGLDKPTSWPTAVVPGAVAAGNVQSHGATPDIGSDVAALAGSVAEDGFSVNGFASRPGFNWALIGQRTSEGVPIYQPDLQGNPGGNLYGYPLNEVTNGAWQSSTAELLAADWSKFIVGVRQDITFKMFDQGVVSDDSGNVVVNLMQQDSQAMRVVFRVGFQVANPLTRLNVDESTRYPAGVLAPAATTP